jgi:hypothetical protein
LQSFFVYILIVTAAGYSNGIGQRLEKVGYNLKQTDEDLKSLSNQLSNQKIDIMNQLGDRCDIIEGQAKFFKAMTTERLDKVVVDLTGVAEQVDGILNGNTSAVVKLEGFHIFLCFLVIID